MEPARLAQISALAKSLGEHLQMLQVSKAELLEVLHETDKTAEELRAHLEGPGES